jgi:hypothetical protein
MPAQPILARMGLQILSFSGVQGAVLPAELIAGHRGGVGGQPGGGCLDPTI